MKSSKQRTYDKPVEAKTPSEHKPKKTDSTNDAAYEAKPSIADNNLLVQSMHRQGLPQAKDAITLPQLQHTMGNQALQRSLRAVRQGHTTDSTTLTTQMHDTAQRGLHGNSQPLPHLEAIQRSFGQHAVLGTQAFVGGAAKAANEQMGSSAYATGESVAFSQTPDLHTAAHEAAHTVQQQAGLQLPDGVGKSGDRHERHADAVADAVVKGESAESLLDGYGTTRGTASVQVQHQDDPNSPTIANEEDCESHRKELEACESDLQKAIDSSNAVIALFQDFLDGKIDMKTAQAQMEPWVNAFEGVTGAGHDLPQVVQDKVSEVEQFSWEEVDAIARLTWQMVFGDKESRLREHARREIARQEHLNELLEEAKLTCRTDMQLELERACRAQGAGPNPSPGYTRGSEGLY